MSDCDSAGLVEAFQKSKIDLSSGGIVVNNFAGNSLELKKDFAKSINLVNIYVTQPCKDGDTFGKIIDVIRSTIDDIIVNIFIISEQRC